MYYSVGNKVGRRKLKRAASTPVTHDYKDVTVTFLSIASNLNEVSAISTNIPKVSIS